MLKGYGKDGDTSTVVTQLMHLPPSACLFQTSGLTGGHSFSLNHPGPQSMNHYPVSSRARHRTQTISPLRATLAAHWARLLRIGFFALALTAALQAADCVAQPALLLDPAFQTHQRPGVPFDHDRHAEDLDCLLCHHSYENGENAWEPDMETRCSACHEAGDRGRLGLRQAWHGQCVGCHEKSPAAPVTCGQCHVRAQAGGPR